MAPIPRKFETKSIQYREGVGQGPRGLTKNIEGLLSVPPNPSRTILGLSGS